MSPWELFALYVVVPLVAVMTWVSRRYESDGADVPEFEAWCRSERPVLFALRCAPGRAREVAGAAAQAMGPLMEVENHRGRYPWTRYLFMLELEHDAGDDVVRARVKRCAIRRLSQTRPEMGAVVDRLTIDVAHALTEVWIHAELREDDEERDDRRERGWLAPVHEGRPGDFAPTRGLPPWARVAA